MGELSDLITQRLSATLEELGLDRRAYHLLKRRGIHRVGDIIAYGKEGILNIKGMGFLTTNHIFSVVARYLNAQEEELFGTDIMQKAKTFTARHLDPLDTPLNILNLPSSVLNTLASSGLFVLRDLLGWKSGGANGHDTGIVNTAEIKQIYSEFVRYLAESENSNTAIPDLKEGTQPVSIDLNTVIAAILTDERTIKIVKLRALQLLTLEEIAAEVGGVTRERIRQIIYHVHKRIRENLGLFTMCCQRFEGIVEESGTQLEAEGWTVSRVVEQFKSRLGDAYIVATDDELAILIAVIRLVAIHEISWISEKVQTRWKKLSFLACYAAPPIKAHPGVGQVLAKEEEQNRRVSYKELALTILSKEQKPMHWSRIAEKAYHLGRRDSFNSTALYNALMSDPDLFVRVDAGTYALAEWGFNRVDTYPDIIASILKSHKKALPGEKIFFKVDEIRPIKRVTLTMLLDLHPRFYKSLEQTYGLRVWLPDREKQTLRTPEWLIEDSDSYRRLEHAIQRGYDVESILKADQIAREN